MSKNEQAIMKVMEWVTAPLSGMTHSEQRAFMVGAAAGSGCLLALQLTRRLGRRSRRRSLSHLHHLDERATLHNASPRGQLTAQAGAEGRGLDGDGTGERSVLFQVVLTGGPCAGKSSSMEFLASRLRKLGYDVYQVPEVPTLMLNGGCVYPGLDGGERLVTFEASLIELQLQMEQSFYNIASSTGRPSIILYDRGLLDVSAFLPRALWTDVLNYNQWVRDGMLGVLERYDLILHLVTAANGAEKHFRLPTGRPAAEALTRARELDEKVQSSYRGHPHHHIVDNSTDFAGKLERVYEHLEAMLQVGGILRG